MAQTATSKRLPILPSMPKGRGATAWNKCACGCGGGTQSTFVPGHDARLRGLMIRSLRGIMSLEEIAEWGGQETRKAVEAGLRSPQLIKRWNLEPEIEAAKEREVAEAADNEADATDDDEDNDDDAADEGDSEAPAASTK